MDNSKTGSLIRELRKEKGLTQKDIAERLHITDRAVSKWERGICAPDISTLEPLADILDCSVPELIAGERKPPAARSPEREAKAVLDYSIREIRHKVRRTRQAYLRSTLLCLLSISAVCALLLWRSGWLFVIDRSVSPDGVKTITVYDKALDGGAFSMEDATSLIMEQDDGAEWRVTYGDCAYRGVWWAPDSRKYVLAMEYDDGVHLALAWLDGNSESNLSAYLTMGVQAAELSKYGYVKSGGWPDIDYQFLQWARDSASMLIYYSFEDAQHAAHDGYFWYDCMDGTVSAVLELDA